jgi:hypothetical protein
MSAVPYNTGLLKLTPKHISLEHSGMLDITDKGTEFRERLGGLDESSIDVFDSHLT